MTDSKANMGDITVYAGHPFEVALDSQAASTGYCWSLAFMPDCVSLLDIRHETSASAKFGSTAKEVFVFVALKVDQSYIQFNLIRPWDPMMVAQKKTFALIITEQPRTLEQDLESTIGNCRFVGNESGQGGSIIPVTALYMAPINARYMSPFNPKDVAIPPYGVPPRLKVAENPENCLLAYGTPDGVANSAGECLLKYGFPVHMADENSAECNVKYGVPVVKYGIPTMKYGIPTMDYGIPPKMAASVENCVVKYGCPVEILEDNANCIVKYGIPGVVGQDSDNCTVKYGIPTEVSEDPDNCVVKYGIPTGIAKDPGSCVLKYGFPVKTAEDKTCLLKYGAPVDPKK